MYSHCISGNIKIAKMFSNSNIAVSVRQENHCGLN